MSQAFLYVVLLLRYSLLSRIVGENSDAGAKRLDLAQAQRLLVNVLLEEALSALLEPFSTLLLSSRRSEKI
jgi:hypothetical protein